MKASPFRRINAVTLLLRVLLALSFFSAIPLLISCSGGGTPPTAAELAAGSGSGDDGGGGGSDSAPVEVPGVPSTINLASTTPESGQIYIAGSGATELITLSFLVKDITDKALGGVKVNFVMLNELGGGERLNNNSGTTDGSGLVTTVFRSGGRAGTAQIRASVDVDPSKSCIATISVTDGLPTGNAFGLSFGPLNIQGLMTHGLTQEVRTDISDYYSNPVAPNIQVNFQTDYASVLGSGTFSSVDATASVFTSTITTSYPDPDDGFVQVAAQTIGGDHSKVLALAVDPTDDNVVYAGTDGGGVFKTVDAGQSWQLVGGPLKDTIASKYVNLIGTIVRALVVDTSADTHNEVVYAGTDKGVFVSTNGGANWSTVSGRRRIVADNIGVTTGFNVDATDPTNGSGWQVFNFHNDYSGVRSRLKVLVNGVETTDFDFSEDGIFILDNFDDGVHGPGYLGAGLVVEADYDTESSLPLPVYALAVNPDPADFDEDLGHAKTIWAGTYGHGVWKTSDGGRHWARASSMTSGSFGEKVLSLAINSAAPTELFAGSDPSGGSVAGVFKTVNGGATWTKMPGIQDEVRAIVMQPAAPVAKVWIAGKNGIHYSTDGGSTWQTPVTKTSASDPLNNNVRAIVRDDVDGTLFAATFGDALDRSEPHGGVYKSVDNGVNWSKVVDLAASQGAHALDSMAVVGKSGADLLYAGSEGRNVFQSLDSGGTWTAVNGQSPTNLNNTLFASGEVMHSGHLLIDIVPLSASYQGMGRWYDGIYNNETVSFYIQISDIEHGNRLVPGTTISISTDTGSSSGFDITLPDGVYGGTDYSVAWLNDLTVAGADGCLTVAVDGPNGTETLERCWYMHGVLAVDPTSIDLTMAWLDNSVAASVNATGGSDTTYTFSCLNGSITAGGYYTYTNGGMGGGQVVYDIITVTDDRTGQSINIPVSITKAADPTPVEP